MLFVQINSSPLSAHNKLREVTSITNLQKVLLVSILVRLLNFSGTFKLSHKFSMTVKNYFFMEKVK